MKMNNWNLEKIYPGCNSKEFNEDFDKAQAIISDLLKQELPIDATIQVVSSFFKRYEEASEIIGNLDEYLGLRLSVNTQDTEAMKAYGRTNNLEVSAAPIDIKFGKYIKAHPNFLDEAQKDPYLSKYPYYLSKQVEAAKRMLSDDTEIMLAKLEKSSGEAWSQLFDTLTSTVQVDYEGKTITLPEVRNLAYSPLQDVRKKAYLAEIASYKKIDKSISAALSSIKEEVTTINEARGYSSPIEKTLVQTGMTKKTLEALTSTIEEYYPIFRAYLKRKGELLGDKNGCPFYDLFAPMGKNDITYTIPDANEYIVSRFTKFNPEIGNMMKKAMSSDWIDYLPKEGKVGGAFCASVFKIKESRILTNFDGSFGSICTLSHELGHAYHNEVMWNLPALYSIYPMQLAETASTFNETFIKSDAIMNAASDAEKLNILESSLQDDTQVIVDIMSRYYFELSVFEKSKDAALSSDELCELMKEAQLRSYGDGLDPSYLHPYMWCCKGHYYSTGLSFYNFPYAFGQLFAYGLYSIYEKEGPSFFTLYKKVLQNAGQMPIKECVALAGIDCESKDFWHKSLDLIKEKIEQFLKITE